MEIKKEYIKKIERVLRKNKVEKSEEIIAKVNKLFDEKLSIGKSEHEIALELGKPEDFVKQYLGENFTQNKKRNSKIQMVFICICTILALGFIVSSVLIGTETINIDETKQYEEQITTSVYLKSTETNFNNDLIEITLENVARVDYKNRTVHLVYLNSAGENVGVAYSEQKIITIKANSTKIISFANPGWTYSPNYEIYACVQDKESVSVWHELKNDKEFYNYAQNHKNNILYLTISESLFASLF